jgi:hypothetical protein
MNSKQAKAEPLPDFLGRLGYSPAHIRGNDVWYRSPFRPDERTPSFKVDRVKNVWYDHGMGQGGTIIDFVQELHGHQEVARTLATISEILMQAPRPAIELPPTIDRKKETPIIESVRQIADQNLEAYLTRRGISLDLARLYLQEVSYRVGERGYVALGFGNDESGFEIRNPGFKGTLGKKAITTFAMKEEGRAAAVFEGFFDFLSVLTHYKRDRANANVVVLNSLSLLEQGVARLDSLGTQRIHAYFDHDEAGRGGLQTLSELRPWRVTDASSLYLGYKDANNFLV